MTDSTSSARPTVLSKPFGEEELPVAISTSYSAEWAGQQALASAMIEGYEPSPDFLEDMRLMRAGLITSDELKLRIMNRALTKSSKYQRRSAHDQIHR